MAKPVRARVKENKARHHIREWRKFRGLTQEELAERVGVTSGNISHLENGNQNYTQPILEAIAEALDCTPADLLVRLPGQPDGVWAIWETLDPPAKIQAAQILETFRKPGSNS